MNRYLWVALGLLVMLAASVTAIFTFDVSLTRTKNEIELALKAVVACASVGTAVFGWVGGRKRLKEREARTSPRPASMPSVIQTVQLSEMGEWESCREYVGQMRRRLLELAGELAGFVPLTTVADTTKPVTRPELLPNLEWLSRKTGHNFTSAEPEQIDLSAVPERFERAVLLGEPGSGKSTCLRQLVLTELDRFERGKAA
ncbi:MAG TPA: hypothetical protein VGX25_12905, partial [Actinophytocola sp.]|uniref:hypothetical protein n=1 Tax=Actinophytocola sp. TaxID=1872138 RepID=UPI002DDDA13C